MKFEEIYERGYSYKESFFYGDMLEDSKLYEFPEGVFCWERLARTWSYYGE